MTQIGGEWLTSAATQAVFDAFEAKGIALYCVGGCVRNALLRRPVADVDMCTPAPPETVQRICSDAGLKTIPTGISHGTITAVSEGSTFEITTFRKDVETDGRHAIVAFSGDIEDDARRRDFTINALYADRAGTVVDPLNGLPDLHAGRLRFIDDPVARIREDYLRILRFFRFYARFAQESPDPDTLDAIARNTDGIAHLSSERVTAELLNLLGAPDPSQSIAIMQQTGVLSAVLPGADPRFLAPLLHVEAPLGLAPDPVLRLASLAGSECLSDLRLSNAQRKKIADLQMEAVSGYGPEALGATLGQCVGVQAVALRCAMMSVPPAPTDVQHVKWGADQIFPVRASDLQPDYAGPALGARLRQLKAAWLVSGLTLSKDALLSTPDE